MNEGPRGSFPKRGRSKQLGILISLALSFLLTTSTFAQWAMHVGGATSDYVTGMAVDGSGNVYITGFFGGSGDFDPGAGTTTLTSAGNSDIFLAKYSTSGTLLWAESLGGTADEQSSGLVLDGSGNIFLTGFFNGTADFDPSGATANLNSLGGKDIFFAKYNSSGALVWAKGVGSIVDDEGHAVATDGANLYVAGTFSAEVDFDPGAGTTTLAPVGGVSGFFSEYSSTGALVWAKSLSGSSTNILGIAVDGIGSVHIVGYFSGTTDFDPSGSTTNVTLVAAEDGFLAQYDNLGALQWVNPIGGAGYDHVQSVTIDGNNDICISGKFEQTVDFNPSAGVANRTSNGFSDMFVAKYDGSGAYQWANAIGGTGIDYGWSVAADASLNVYLGGTNAPNGSYFAKFNSSGTAQWSNNIAIAVPDYVKSIGVDGSGNVYLTGVFAGTIDFDPGAGTTNLTSTGLKDVYFAKYLNTGALPVELTSLTAYASGVDVQLHWVTATESNNYGFEVERAIHSGLNGLRDWQKVGFVEGHGTTNTPQSYSFADNPISFGTYSYRLKQIDRDGNFKYTEAVSVEIHVPNALTLSQNYPNPFNPSTTIEFTLPEHGRVVLTVYDVLGKEVATLVNADLEAGVVHHATLDASNISSGIYFFRLRHKDTQLMKKLLVMK